MLVNGTTYPDGTPEKLVRVLEASRQNGTRLRIHYGNPDDGVDWLEERMGEGRIGRSCGRFRVPILLHNVRSVAGPALLTENVLRVTTRIGRYRRCLYQHPNYRMPELVIRDMPPRDDLLQQGRTYPFEVCRRSGMVPVARFRTRPQALRYVHRMEDLHRRG